VPEGPEDRCFSDLVFGRQLRHGLAVGVALGDLALLVGVECVRFRNKAASTSAGRRCPNFITGIRSDLPGQITAQVTEAVFDTPTGRIRLIPQGARLIGTYDSQVAFGQSRVLLAWTRLIMPNGRSIVLERQPGADAAGYSGLGDEVDYHWKELLGAAALSTVLAVGTDVNSGADVNNTNGALIQALRRGTGDSLNQTGQQVVRRNLLEGVEAQCFANSVKARVTLTPEFVVAPPSENVVPIKRTLNRLENDLNRLPESTPVRIGRHIHAKHYETRAAALVKAVTP
jgi:Bacterial conjugation TrbI-like protein